MLGEKKKDKGGKRRGHVSEYKLGNVPFRFMDTY